MTTIGLRKIQPGTLWKQNGSLSFLGFFALGLVMLTAVAAIIDGRIITNVNGWIKPMKFGLSFIFYAFTLLWMLSFVKQHPRIVRLLSVATLVGGVMEMLLITLQVFRNTTSHFNNTTLFDTTVYSLMAVFVIVLWLANLGVAILLMRQKFTNSTLGWSVRLGLIVALLGAAFGFIMTSATTEAQQAAFETTGRSNFAGAHSIGVEDGAEPSIPFVGWNSQSGDVRVPHFFGLHGLQAIPLLALLLLNWRSPRINDRKRTQLLIVGGLGYLSFTFLTLWQALRGQSIIAPDLLTLTSFSLLIVGIAAASLVILVRAPQSPATDRRA